MFILQKSLVTNETDLTGRELVTKTKTVYLFEGQNPSKENLHPETQAYNKKLFVIQEEASAKAGRPVSIFEALKFGL